MSTRTIGRWKARVIVRKEKPTAVPTYGIALKHRDDGREYYFDSPGAVRLVADEMLRDMTHGDIERLTSQPLPELPVE